MKILMIDALGVLGLAIYDLRLCESLAALNGGSVTLEVPEGFRFKSSCFTIRRGSRHMEKELGKLSRIWDYLKWLQGIAVRAREWQPDIIHWQLGFFPFFDLLVTRRLKAAIPRARVVITVHDARAGKPIFSNVFARKHFFRSADGVVAHSAEARKDYQHWIGGLARPAPVTVILHGPYDAPESSDLSPGDIRRHFGLDSQGPVIISIGSINENKDFATCFKLVAELQKKCPGVNFLIGGSSGGEDLSPLFEWQRQVPSPEKIVILDRYLTDDEVDQAHRIADFSLLIYKLSATSGAAIRSLCAGVPVIGNDRPGFRAVIQDGWNGFVVKENDTESEAQRIYQFLQNPEVFKTMKENAQATYQEVTWEQVAREHYNFYQELMGNPEQSAAT